MSNIIFDGKALSNTILNELKAEISQIQTSKSLNSQPKLAYIYMEIDPSTSTYLQRKQNACNNLGILTQGYLFSNSSSELEILSLINNLNQDPTISGILVQLPLAKNINVQLLIDSIDITKDIDGLHSMNIGKLSLKGYEPLYYPCTALGCLEILKRNNVDIIGKHAVIIGRSNLVGMPVGMLLQKHNATVTMCHSFTENVEFFTRQADILVLAVGCPGFIRRDMVKFGAVVLDIGINMVDGEIVGDVEKEVAEVSGFLTPVPGGVGPMTVAMLMKNVVKAWKLSLGYD